LDSLTQIVLGGAVGEAVLGKKVGNKAILWGAIGGTIPDLDTFVGNFLDPVSSLEIHRGFSHSIVFAILIAPILGYLVNRIYRKKKETDWWGWTQLFFWSVFTHPILDAFTTWGTQLFWPSEWRIAIQSIFVIDPIYTIPFLISLVAVMVFKRNNANRSKWNKFGLIWSTSYLLITLLIKAYVNFDFEEKLKTQKISYLNFESRPSPLNTILWSFNVEQETDFLIGYTSLFDSKETLELKRFPKNEALLKPYRNHPDVERLIKLTKGLYVIEKIENSLHMHDLRFGLMERFNGEPGEFVFTYIIENINGEIIISRKENSFEDSDQILAALWNRIWGRS
tara:strand:+ start:9951 stop:10964 length:1014 start_codon:yes stop_codon:yes gene_type:complete